MSGPIRSYLFEAFADRYFPFAQRDGRVDAATAHDHARMMVGTYSKTRRLETNFLKAMELAGLAPPASQRNFTACLAIIKI